jgi:hypothetical protein
MYFHAYDYYFMSFQGVKVFIKVEQVCCYVDCRKVKSDYLGNKIWEEGLHNTRLTTFGVMNPIAFCQFHAVKVLIVAKCK